MSDDQEEARRAILRAIRSSLATSAPHDVVHAERHKPPTPSHGPSLPVLKTDGPASAPRTVPEEPLDMRTQFQRRVEAVAGVCTVARGTEEVVAAIERILSATGARRVATSDSERVIALTRPACERAGAELLIDAAPTDLFDCDAGVSGAQWGIAETGTLALESAQERHRFVSLVPRVHIALLRADRIRESLGEVLREVRSGARGSEVASAAITLITGPSRTSDIELTLAIGVHGPQELHVIIIEPEGTEPTEPSQPDHATSAGESAT